ncbi:Pyruvate/2-oxoglutarate/acetoin dehydrogenase complex, dehydrogenase (E1) component [Hydrobacter penzbergensis]|uniref:3-methyl-2-oxobutanoate dehydrogenase (2-methylpropanoyl-transferring) n=2 Tax=Hydrobacter penzbergensis TaxID=1235997 RepID=A0A8X8IFR8_9BACT|nr:pyruvate/2-oxoglutarate/acetoin dehydrogenase E1 component [Sediminibacterium magnilacihabitans]SDW81835.1 Pyruvate/2-oxoglutarate/acetoin dehydrogenase complex, dehydrogenase (E1) component [Hydrobacter penzbergensis]
MLSFDGFRNAVMQDYRIAVVSREVSLLGRREVLTGKAKFGIFGDGKEVAQVAMAKFFQKGDFRSGYYRDQTFMFATGLATVEQYFAQLYADPDIEHDPFSAGRQMNAHFATPFVDEAGNWLDLANRKNISSDIAPTAGQMPRSLGLAFASKCFRSSTHKKELEHLSNNGNEICFCTIGDASTTEGHFWETMNAAGVLQVPLAVFVWDDGYGISVPKNIQTTKGSISTALRGFQKGEDTNGINIYKVKAWDYAGMCEVFEEALHQLRDTHVPVLFHVEEVTQPQGHSTSGSHERYKSPERLEWEKEWDCLKKMKEWMIENELATADELAELEAEAKTHVRESRNLAWEKYLAPIKAQAAQAAELIRGTMVNDIDLYGKLQQQAKDLQNNKEPLRRDVLRTLALAMELAPQSPSVAELKAHSQSLWEESKALYNSHLYNEGPKSAMNVQEVKPLIPSDAPLVNGYEVLNKYFDALFTSNPKVYAFGEDVGHIGDVNQGFAGLQDKHGKDRILDTGIRELTIVGQGIGMALRGLRPIAEIQYLDYLLYGLQPLSDDVATTHFRTKGQHSCPLIIRTRGHRLEGIWHSGSPLGMMINALRGLYICVPRNMVQAAGFYNTLLQSNDPAIVVECLNGYRLKEKLPSNLLEFTVPLGIPEVIREGTDITIVSYGSTLRIIQDATDRLAKEGISCEVIDVQTLLPFDIHHQIVESLKKTSRIVFIDEDVPGGASAYMYNKVMEEQKGYQWLDAAPRTITAKAHRTGYGSDGDYFGKPNAEEIINVIREVMAE